MPKNGYERKFTRVDDVRIRLDKLLYKISDNQKQRDAYVHLYGVGQAATMIALKRGMGREIAELAMIAGMLHDYTKYLVEDTDDHAHLSEPYARELLRDAGSFTNEEIDMVCRSIYNHSDKHIKGEPFEEVIKDADVLQHYLRNPMEDFFYEHRMVKRLIEELEL